MFIKRGLPLRSPDFIGTKRGEIATVLAIGMMIVIGITTFISSQLFKTKQTTSTKAAEIGPQVTCRNNPWPQKAPADYCWLADCSKQCNDNSGCPKNTTSGYVDPNTSNWCYGFVGPNNSAADWRCLMLIYKNDSRYSQCLTGGGGNQPTNTPTNTPVPNQPTNTPQPAAPTYTPRPGQPSSTPTATPTTSKNCDYSDSNCLGECTYPITCQNISGIPNCFRCVNPASTNTPIPTMTGTQIKPTATLIPGQPTSTPILLPVKPSLGDYLKKQVNIEYSVAGYTCGFMTNLSCQLHKLNKSNTKLCFAADEGSIDFEKGCNKVDTRVIELGKVGFGLETRYRLLINFICKKGESFQPGKYLFDDSIIVDVSKFITYNSCD